jgi:hypothetical protein
MTSSEAAARAEMCAQLASQMSDPMKRTLLQQMRQAWLNLAAEVRKPSRYFDEEFELFLEVEAALLRRPNIGLHLASCNLGVLPESKTPPVSLSD